MLRRLFALMNRSLRTEVRQLPGHLIRFFLCAYIMLLLTVSMASQSQQGAAGLEFFRVIVYLNLVVLLAASVFYFSTSLTEEKEEQTIGLLRMANVGPGTLIFGKAVPRLIWVLLLLTIQFPFTVLGITLGGMTLTQVTACYWTLFTHVLLIGGVGTFSSSFCRRSGTACVVTIAAMLFFYIGSWVLDAVVSGWADAGVLSTPVAAKLGGFAEKWSEASAFSQAGTIFSLNFEGPIFGIQVVSNTLIALVLFVMAGVLFDFFNASLDTTVSRRPWFHFSWKRNRQSVRVWNSPLAWKDFHFIAGGPASLVVKTVIYAFVVFVIALLTESGRIDRMTAQGLAITSFWSGIVIAYVEGAFLAARIYRAELVDQTWASLLMVPVNVQRLSVPKVFGCCLALIPALLCIVASPLISPDLAVEVIMSRGGAATFVLSMVSTVCVFAMFVTFTAMFSLEMSPWLAIPLAAFTVFTAWPILGCCLFAPLAGAAGPSGETYMGIAVILSVVILCATAVGVGLLHKSILTRLERLGA
jgi:hypothetical protein